MTAPVSSTEPLFERLAALRAHGERAGRKLAEQHEKELDVYLTAVRDGVKLAIDRLNAAVDEISGGNATCRSIVRDLAAYVDWLQWSLWDLPAIGVAVSANPERLKEGVASCGMIYLSMRVVDDAIDRHHRYKGRHDTMLAMSQQHRTSGQSADVLALMGGLLLCFEGMRWLPADIMSAGGDRTRSLQSLLDSVRNTVLGVIMELSPPESWSSSFYERLVRLKNVEFWRVLFASVDPTASAPFRRFLEGYYALSQKLNDVQDQPDDEQRGQPNLISIQRMEVAAGTGGAGNAVMAAVEKGLGEEFCQLAERAAALPARERLVAEAKLGESLAAAHGLGLFAAAAGPAPQPPAARARLGLEWYSEIKDVVSKLGPDALVEVACAVCGSTSRRHILWKQGFAFHRCLGCTHVYVSPRLRADLSAQLGSELDEMDHHSTLLEVQKYYAGAICALLRARAPGSRLLDIGFGRGYLMDLSRAYGFDAYGVESSRAQLDRLDERLGRRLHEANAEDGPLPWGSFDVVIMSHVLEHLDSPRDLLAKVRAALNPEGIVYIAVPDIASAQFGILGKRWDAITPLAHVQYFNQSSLEQALKAAGFDEVERIQPVEVPDDLVPAWMRLMRRLGGSDSGELAVVARMPAS